MTRHITFDGIDNFRHARHQPHILQVPVFTLDGNALLGPHPPNHADRFFETLAALGHRHAVDLEFLRQEGAAEAGVEAPLAHVVEHRQVAAEVGRVVEGRDHRAGDQADAFGPRRDGGEEHAGIRRMPAVVVERMLDRLGARVAELIRAHGQAQALVVIVGRARVFLAKRRKEINSESHGGCPPATRLASGISCAAGDRRPSGAVRQTSFRAAPGRAPPAASCWPPSAPARTRC